MDSGKYTATLEDIGTEIELPYEFDTALELWVAWRDHGIMPRAGGYLEQPRQWRYTMRVLNSRHTPIYQQYMTKDRDTQQDDETRWIDGDADIGQPFDLGRWIESPKN